MANLEENTASSSGPSTIVQYVDKLVGIKHDDEEISEPAFTFSDAEGDEIESHFGLPQKRSFELLGLTVRRDILRPTSKIPLIIPKRSTQSVILFEAPIATAVGLHNGIVVDYAETVGCLFYPADIEAFLKFICALDCDFDIESLPSRQMDLFRTIAVQSEPFIGQEKLVKKVQELDALHENLLQLVTD